jgi:hypothetical protein
MGQKLSSSTCSLFTFPITPTISELFGDKSWTASSGLTTMSGVAFNLNFAFALERGDFISSLSDSIDSLRRYEEVETRSTTGIQATHSLLLGSILILITNIYGFYLCVT